MDAGVFKSAFARDMLTASTPTRRDALRQLLATPGKIEVPHDAEARTPWTRDADVELTRAKQECARLSRENAWLRESTAHEPDAQSLAWRLRGAEQAVDMQRRVLREVAAFLTRAAQPECNSTPRSRGVPGQVTWPRVRRTEPCCHDQQVAAEAFRLLRTVQSLLGITHAPRAEALSPVDELVTSSCGHDESGFSSMSSFLDVSPINDSHNNDSHNNDTQLQDASVNDSHIKDSPGKGSRINDSLIQNSRINDSHFEDSHVKDSHIQYTTINNPPTYASSPNTSPLEVIPQDEVAFSPRHTEKQYGPTGIHEVAHDFDNAEVGLPRFQSGLPRFKSGLPSRSRPQRSMSFSLPRPAGGGVLRQSEDFASLRVLWV